MNTNGFDPSMLIIPSGDPPVRDISSDPVEKVKSDNVISVQPFGDDKYRDLNTNFVVDECNFYGVADGKNIRVPTQDELTLAYSMGFQVEHIKIIS